MLSKYVWLIGVEEISFIRSCDVEKIKAMDCIIKVHITRGNIKWRSFALRFYASNHKSAWQPLLPSSKGLSFIIIFYLMKVSWWSSPFLFTFYTLARIVCWKDPDIYIANWMWVFINNYCWHYPWGKRLGGKTWSPYLSLCPMNTICSKNMLWVVEIMEDYMIVEYVGFAESKLLHRPFLKIRWIAIVWWLRT